MSWLKKFDNYLRRSNERWFRSMEQSEQARYERDQAQEAYDNSLECCANCIYFGCASTPFGCVRHNFEFDLDDMKYRKIHYKKVCRDFCRR